MEENVRIAEKINLTVEEAALISNLGKDFLRTLIYKKEINYFKRGSKVLIPRVVLDEQSKKWAESYSKV